MKDQLKSIELVNFKGFNRHTIAFRQSNILVGANNSGKSTALAAIRLISHMLPEAKRQTPRRPIAIDGIRELGWPVTDRALERAAFSTDNLKHDFSNSETRIVVTTSSQAKIFIVWPETDSEETLENGIMVIRAGQKTTKSAPRDIAKYCIPDIAVIPRLTPLDEQESLVTDDTFRNRIKSGRSSRYFRNALERIEKDDFPEFLDFIKSHTPEVCGLEIAQTPTNKGIELDLYYVEGETNREREIAWAGDGIQIWLQLMYHLWTGTKSEVIVMDEPDVFLHPDLQRRIARIISSHSSQTIIATHSVEIIAEAMPGSTVWIDRNRRHAERSKGDGILESAGRRLGSGFELGIGRALRSRVALFVEGKDTSLLALLARNLGLNAFASSDNYATVPMGGFSKNDLAKSFNEVLKILGSTISVYVILDSDLRSSSILQATVDYLTVDSNNVKVFIWKRRELENYLLSPNAIAKTSRISIPEAQTLMDQTVDDLRQEALDTFLAARLDDSKKPGSGTARHSATTIVRNGGIEFNDLWNNPLNRIGLIDAKEAISRMNSKLQADGHPTLEAMRLARNIEGDFISMEVVNVLSEIDNKILEG
ncbi:hypothetical protein D3C74_14380 [compost metagenome]